MIMQSVFFKLSGVPWMPWIVETKSAGLSSLVLDAVGGCWFYE
jgi:hypothetical protein